MSRTLQQIDLALTAVESKSERSSAGLKQDMSGLTSALEGEIQSVLDLVGSRGSPADGVAPTGMCADLANIVQVLGDIQSTLATLGSTLPRSSSTQTVDSVPDGGSAQTQAWTLSGVGSTNALLLALSAPLPPGVVAMPKVSSPGSVLVEICNLSGAAYTPGTLTFTVAYL